MELLVRLAADGILVAILLVGLMTVLPALRQEFWKNAPVLIMAGLTSLLIGKVLSLLYQPKIARPFLELGSEPGASYVDNPGFPSDHALLATVVVVAIYVVTRSRMLVGILIVLMAVMCTARVVALVHTPFDVIGGIGAGVSGAFWYRKLTKKHE